LTLPAFLTIGAFSLSLAIFFSLPFWPIYAVLVLPAALLVAPLAVLHAYMAKPAGQSASVHGSEDGWDLWPVCPRLTCWCMPRKVATILYSGTIFLRFIDDPKRAGLAGSLVGFLQRPHGCGFC
jgi:hypothetical protein